VRKWEKKTESEKRMKRKENDAPAKSIDIVRSAASANKV
jgi:hypothetical protein